MPRAGTFLHGLTQQQVESLREAAQVLGFAIKRGAGAGREGSMAELIAALADAYEREPDRVLHFFGLLVDRPWRLPAKYLGEVTAEPPQPEDWNGTDIL